jgi:3' exoribonuclease, RNase T-like
MNHAMIDIETLSKQPNGAIISIGVAIFNDQLVTASDGWALDPKCWHGHLDPETIHWWAAQNEAAREFSFTGKFTDVTAAFNLKTLLAQHNVQEVWANDPQFDLVMLQQWWERLGKSMVGDFPIHYRQPRSYRTICALAEEIDGVDPRKSWAGNYVAHNPIEDAVSQARVVIASRNIIPRLPVVA